MTQGLRIVGGELGGRRIALPKGASLRPTSERVREAMASALQSHRPLQGAVVYDLFAGTGAMAFELLSRGASQALLVERDVKAFDQLRRNASQLALEERLSLLRLDLLARPQGLSEWCQARALPLADFVFIDPPYAEVGRCAALLRVLAEVPLLREEGLLAFEYGKEPPPELLPWRLLRRYRYGETTVALFSLNPP